jgi:hypothetical protein
MARNEHPPDPRDAAADKAARKLIDDVSAKASAKGYAVGEHALTGPRTPTITRSDPAPGSWSHHSDPGKYRTIKLFADRKRGVQLVAAHPDRLSVPRQPELHLEEGKGFVREREDHGDVAGSHVLECIEKAWETLIAPK